ncbi:YtpI family protein [Bacillus sp. DJP31]|uniref:YtpI family protein n=1 Tax=Bacillus sp. DJP31 TaxID=3409789 RepID=UPI003BB5856E
MPIFIILIIFSLSFYAYFKIKYFRVKEPMHRGWISAKSSIALGAFIVCFALNQMIALPTTIALIIGIILLLVGGGSIWAGVKAYKYYYPRVVEEARNNKKTSFKK